MSNLVIAPIPPTLVEFIFPKCAPHLLRVIEKAPEDINLATIKQKLIEGKTMMVCVLDRDQVIAVNILETAVYETGHKVLYIPITGGDRMDEWLDRFMRIAHTVARDQNCDELRGMACRKGWLRALNKAGHDWYHVHEVIGCKVKPLEQEESE